MTRQSSQAPPPPAVAAGAETAKVRGQHRLESLRLDRGRGRHESCPQPVQFFIIANRVDPLVIL
jgi:hypothetical protein